MCEEEILNYYDENWNDYNKIVNMLHKIIDEHEDEVAELQKRLTESYLDSSKFDDNNQKRMEEMKKMLQECQDKLDEETHKL